MLGRDEPQHFLYQKFLLVNITSFITSVAPPYLEKPEHLCVYARSVNQSFLFDLAVYIQIHLKLCMDAAVCAL